MSFGFGELGILSNFEEDKSWKANQELIRKESVGNQLPTIQECGVANDIGAAISGNLGNGGGQSSLLAQQEAKIGDRSSLL